MTDTKVEIKQTFDANAAMALTKTSKPIREAAEAKALIERATKELNDFIEFIRNSAEEGYDELERSIHFDDTVNELQILGFKVTHVVNRDFIVSWKETKKPKSSSWF